MLVHTFGSGVAADARLRTLECLLLFGGAPLLLLWLVPPAWWPWLLAVAGLLCVALWWCRGPPARRRWLGPLRPLERERLGLLGWRFGGCALLLLGLIALLAPERLFNLPREDTTFWLLLLASYPLFSVLPQEAVYRYLFRLRYRRLFGPGWVWASALGFGWLHIVFANPVAPLLCLLGGWLFADTYRRTGSLRLTVAEHTLYGALVFSVGIGDFFFHAGPALLA